MPSHSTRRTALVLFLGVVALALPATGRAQLPVDDLARPLAAPPSARLESFAGGQGRQGLVAVRPELLDRVGRPGSVTLRLELFDRAPLEVELRPADDRNEGRIWVGRVVGQPLSRVHLRRVGNSLAGTLRTRDGILQLLPDGPGRAVVTLAQGPPLPDVVLPAPASLRGEDRPRPQDPPPAGADEESTRIDLLVIIEKEVINQTRGLGGWLKTTIRNSVVDLNLALADSGIDAWFNLQTIKRDRYAGDGDDSNFAAQLLFDTANPDDNLMKKTQRLRKKFGSDLVAVIMQRNTGVCGMGFISGDRGRGVQPEDAEIAFSVTSWRCLVTGTLPHEIGHNMGGQHSHVDPTSSVLGAYDYSYGHKVDLEFYTVMAYSCEFCTPVLLFSNPDVMVDGIPSGVAGGSSPADNAQSFERDREALATFRECQRACQ